MRDHRDSSESPALQHDAGQITKRGSASCSGSLGTDVSWSLLANTMKYCLSAPAQSLCLAVRSIPPPIWRHFQERLLIAAHRLAVVCSGLTRHPRVWRTEGTLARRAVLSPPALPKGEAEYWLYAKYKLLLIGLLRIRRNNTTPMLQCSYVLTVGRHARDRLWYF